MTNAQKLVEALKKKGLIITFVESCTGGALANALTNVVGASAVMKGSFVTYSNEAKIDLGVPREVIDTYSVYSGNCAVAMAIAGKPKCSGAYISVGVTGNLNRIDPDNEKDSCPGTVFVGIVQKTETGWMRSNFTIKVDERASRKRAKGIITNAIFQHLLADLEEIPDMEN